MKSLIPPRVKLACITIPGFENEYEELKRSLLINGRSLSTSQSYCNKLAQLALHFQKTISQITESEIKEFLAFLLTNANSRSQSEFKHMVYGMRYYFRIIGKELAIKLPSIPRRKKLPMVLSKNECRQLFALTKNVKHRTILKLIYSGGLRAGEASNLKWKDIDFDRMTIHIKEAKGNKERHVPLSANILNELATLHQHGIYSQYVFCGEAKTKKMTRSGIRFLMNQAVKRIGLQKTGVCVHTLRHSFATHLLEDGLDILSIKELLGHSRLETTLVYLQISHQTPQKKRSPLDNLLELPKSEELAQYKSHLTELLRKKISHDIEPQSQYRLFD